MCLGTPMPPTLPARILPRPTTTASGAAAVTAAAPTLLTATPAVLAPAPPPVITTLLGTPEPEPKSQADRLFAPEPAPIEKAPPASAAGAAGVDPRKKAARDRNVAPQKITTPGVPKDAADILFGTDKRLGRVQQKAAPKNTQIAQGEALFDSPFRSPASAPINPTATGTEAARRRTSESLRDDPAQSDPFEINDYSFALLRPKITDPAHIEIVLRRKIREAMEDGNDFAADQAKHFLDGGGKARRFTREEARSLQKIHDAEEANKPIFPI